VLYTPLSPESPPPVIKHRGPPLALPSSSDLWRRIQPPGSSSFAPVPFSSYHVSPLFASSRLIFSSPPFAAPLQADNHAFSERLPLASRQQGPSLIKLCFADSRSPPSADVSRFRSLSLVALEFSGRHYRFPLSRELRYGLRLSPPCRKQFSAFVLILRPYRPLFSPPPIKVWPSFF